MQQLTTAALKAAEDFVYGNARLIDRRRYAFHFTGGGADAVLAALRPYANADGGFGNALEPDLRGPGSQPQPVEVAFHILDEIDRFDDRLVRAACDYLASIDTGEGGVPFVLPSARDTLCAWWWRAVAEAGDAPGAQLNPTAPIAGMLAAHAVDHPWTARAVRFCWDRIDAIADAGTDLEPYDARAVLGFLDAVPDRERAAKTAARLREALLSGVTFDPRADGHVHLPLDFAPRPGTLAAALFDDATLSAHLDHLVAAQQDDGGWPINWEAWTPATGPEWRGAMTVDRLLTLRAYGRFPG